MLLILNKLGYISVYFVIVTRIKFVIICKTNAERTGVLNVSYHVSTHIIKPGPYPNNRFTINHKQYLVNIELS